MSVPELQTADLSGAEIDTLFRLARQYPSGVDAGDVPSKCGLYDLVKRGFAQYDGGTAYCTRAGLIAEAAIEYLPGSPSDRATRMVGGSA